MSLRNTYFLTLFRRAEYLTCCRREIHSRKGYIQYYLKNTIQKSIIVASRKLSPHSFVSNYTQSDEPFILPQNIYTSIANMYISTVKVRSWGWGGWDLVFITVSTLWFSLSVKPQKTAGRRRRTLHRVLHGSSLPLLLPPRRQVVTFWASKMPSPSSL